MPSDAQLQEAREWFDKQVSDGRVLASHGTYWIPMETAIALLAQYAAALQAQAEENNEVRINSDERKPMKEEKWKQAVKEVAKNPGYATNASACEKALRTDTAEGYREALNQISKNPYYAVNESIVKKALKD